MTNQWSDVDASFQFNSISDKELDKLTPEILDH